MLSRALRGAARLRTAPLTPQRGGDSSSAARAPPRAARRPRARMCAAMQAPGAPTPPLSALMNAREARGVVKAARVLCWLRQDLRCHDNAVLLAAAAAAKEKGGDASVLPVFCFNPSTYSATLPLTGCEKTGACRAQFMRESVVDLKNRLRALGSDLYVAVGEPEAVLAELAGGEPTAVLTHGEACTEEVDAEVAVANALMARNGDSLLVRLEGGFTMYDERDLPFELRQMKDVFTPVRHKVEDKCEVRASFAAPKTGTLPLGALEAAAGSAENAEVPSLEAIGVDAEAAAEARGEVHPLAALDFHGGESEALKRVKYYLWETDKASTYFDTRNGMLGGDYSTKFEPWLSAGCLSPRHVYAELIKYESARVANKSTYWIRFELLVRDWFRWNAKKHGSRIFMLSGPAHKHVAWRKDLETFQRWVDGKTGVPLIDANMRELAATGFMSNRGRQNVASYLALSLGLDWRLGAEYFESALMGYDPASNWGNWAAAAGVTGGRVNKFNAVKQSKDYDAKGEYVKAWLPELKGVPAPFCHEPWRLTPAQQSQFGCRIGVDYPKPCGEVPAWSPDGNGRGGGGRGGGRGGKGGGRGGGGKGGGRRRTKQIVYES